MKIKEAYEILKSPHGQRDHSVGFAWTKDEADMLAEGPEYKVNKVRVMHDGSAWYKIGELTHLNEPQKTLAERVAEAKIGSALAIETNGHLDILGLLNKREVKNGFIHVGVINGGYNMRFKASTLTASTANNVYRIVAVDQLPADITSGINRSVGLEVLAYVDQALVFLEERIMS